MFNIGPMELVVLGFVALIVIGPEKLPGHAREAAKVLRSLREMANGARGQFRKELGPEFDDLNLDALRELRALNPRSALMKMLFDGNEDPLGLKGDPLGLGDDPLGLKDDPLGLKDDPDGYDHDGTSFREQIVPSAPVKPVSAPVDMSKPAPRPDPSAPTRYDEDAT